MSSETTRRRPPTLAESSLTKPSGSFDPKDYVVVSRREFDLLLDGNQQLIDLMKPLVDERDALRTQCDKLTAAGDELAQQSKILMEKFKVLKAENERLGAAISARMPKIKPGGGKN